MKKELRFVKSGMKMYYKNTLYAGKGGEIFNDNSRDLQEEANRLENAAILEFERLYENSVESN